MCSPMAAGAALFVGIPAAMSIAGNEAQGKAAEDAARYKEQVARNNKIIAERARVNVLEQGRLLEADALARGEVLERRRRDQASVLTGRQRAVLAGNGVVVDMGSALDLVQETATTGELDALTIRNNAAREALGFKTSAEQEAFGLRLQGLGFEQQASLAITEGQNAKIATQNANIQTLVDTAQEVATRWFSFGAVGSGTAGGAGKSTRVSFGSIPQSNRSPGTDFF